MTSEPDESAIPAGMRLADAAKQAVHEFQEASSSQNWFGVVESIEVVDVGDPAGAGIRLMWHQGEHSFGLLMPIVRLAAQAGGLDGVPFYLRLAVKEPHEPARNGQRQWFSDLPSGPY